MRTIRVSDHALVRFLERAGGMDFEPLRAALATSLERGMQAARELRCQEVHVRADGLVYVVKDDVLVTIRDPSERR